MSTYRIEVIEKYEKFISVEANSKDEAYLKAKEMYLDGTLWDDEDIGDVTYWVREM